MQKSQAHSIKDWTAFIGALGALALAVKGQVAPNEPEGEKAREATEASYEALRSAIVDSGRQIERLSVYVEELQKHADDEESRLRTLERESAVSSRDRMGPPEPPVRSRIGLGRIGGLGPGAGRGVMEGEAAPDAVAPAPPAADASQPAPTSPEAPNKPWAPTVLPPDLKALIPLAATKAKQALVKELGKKVEEEKRLQEGGK